MFVGFIVNGLKLENVAEPYFGEEGRKLFEEQKNQVAHSLDNYLLKNDIIDATALENDWFPQIEADVFISHSHVDEKLAIGMAGWLYKLFGIKSFIDSTVWGYSNDLLKEIDKKFCYKEESKIYDYDKRNQTTTHVHMMLNAALHKMIDRTECLFFLNTPNFLMLSESIDKTKYTESPWIYSELLLSQIVRKKPLSEYRSFPLVEMFHADAVRAQYKVTTDHLIPLGPSDTLQWWKKCKLKSSQEALDGLYKMKGILSDGE